MRAREVNQEIEKLSTAFFTEQGYTFNKKEMSYIKRVSGNRVEYGFSYITRSPELYYEIYLYVITEEVEEILSQVDETEKGITYVFPMSYFIDSNNYINKNPKYEVTCETDIAVFVKAFIDNYKKYIPAFVEKITQLENMLEFLEKEISTGKAYARNINVLLRCLILTKLLKKDNFKQKVIDFKGFMKDYDESIKKEYFEHIDRIEALDF